MMALQSINRSRGTTLVELLTVIAIIGIISGILGDLFVTTWKTYHYTNEALAAEQEARVTMEKIAKDLRAASSIESINPQSIIFYRYFESDANPTKIEIVLSSNQLFYKKTPPSGSPPTITYPSESTVTTVLTNNIVNGTETIFTKYNELNVSDVNLTIGQTKMVGVKIIIDINVNRPPSAFELASTVQLRNMKIN